MKVNPNTNGTDERTAMKVMPLATQTFLQCIHPEETENVWV